MNPTAPNRARHVTSNVPNPDGIKLISPMVTDTPYTKKHKNKFALGSNIFIAMVKNIAATAQSTNDAINISAFSGYDILARGVCLKSSFPIFIFPPKKYIGIYRHITAGTIIYFKLCDINASGSAVTTSANKPKRFASQTFTLISNAFSSSTPIVL